MYTDVTDFFIFDICYMGHAIFSSSRSLRKLEHLSELRPLFTNTGRVMKRVFVLNCSVQDT